MDSKWLNVKITVSVQLQGAINNIRRWIQVLSSETTNYKLCRDDIGVIWKAPQAEPRDNLVAYRCWQATAWQTYAIQEVATFLSPQRKFANLGARRDHWVHRCWGYAIIPFPTEIGRDVDLQWKIDLSLSYLLLQFGSNDRDVSLP